ncbi:MAG TPA: glycosyltransferase N-terminal domain-containing protein [Gemmatimonadales bacterium]|nr:glycosyltransferase N-terminal domain-containing protein [Gemmatimonadales bacterium]
MAPRLRPPIPYRLAIRVAGALAGLAALVSRRWRTAHQGRRASRLRFAAWARTARGSAPLILFHASSAGEARQAEPLLRRWRDRHPEYRVAFTWFSPSAEPAVAEFPVDVAGYLPTDTPGEVGRLLDGLRPTLVVVSKLDVWPEFVLAARARGAGLALTAATVRPSSGRLRWLARLATRSAYASFDLVAAIAEPDVWRLLRLGVRSEAITVTGDPRADAVLERLAARPPDPALQRLGAGPPALVAGSTYPPDEDLLLDAFRTVTRTNPGARLIIAPHQPRPAALARLRQAAARRGLPAPVPLEAAGPDSSLVVLDRVGPLAWLYGAGQIAYVGGGFGPGGLHSVLEPAAWGLPILVGPRWRGNPDAQRLSAAGGLAALTGHRAGELAALWSRWLINVEERRLRGGEARAVLERMRGAADRTVALLERYLVEAPTITPS